jgi:hypothetical protein
MTGTRFRQVPYGSAPVMQALLGEQIDFGIESAVTSLPQYRAPARGAPPPAQAGTKERPPGANKGTARSKAAIDDVASTYPPRSARGRDDDGGSVFPAHANTGDPNSPLRGLTANELACALTSMMARSTPCSNRKPDTLMQDRICQDRRKPLHRTAGPTFGSGAPDAEPLVGLFPLYPEMRTFQIVILLIAITAQAQQSWASVRRAWWRDNAAAGTSEYGNSIALLALPRIRNKDIRAAVEG